MNYIDVIVSRLSFPRLGVDDEAAFLKEFRVVGVKWALIAGFAAILLYSVIIALAVFDFDYVHRINKARISIAVLLAALMLTIWFVVDISYTVAVFLVAVGSAGALFGTAFIAYVANSFAPKTIFSIPVALVFGLFLHYGFLRLPLLWAALIGWSASILVILLAPLALGGDTVRHAVYLAFSNIFGMILCHLIESRERELFFQRRSAEAGWAEARKREQEAEVAVQQKGRLIAAVSHDLRQPMTAATLHLDLLDNRLNCADLEGGQTQARKARLAVSSLAGTLDHLLVAAQYESGGVQIQLEWINLSALLEALSETFAFEAQQKGIEFKLLLPRHPPRVLSDRICLERIVSNLVGNAIKFTSPHERRRSGVLLAVRSRSGRCSVEVIDTGIGIASSGLDSIWEPYSRLETGADDRFGGLGLGLFLVKRMAQHLPDHELRVRSQSGRGSRFSISLPAGPGGNAASSDPSGVQTQAAESTTTSLWGAYVLILEDDRLARESMREWLETQGVVVIAAATPRALLAMHSDSERMVDAILCDFRLPGGLLGFAAIETVRSALGYAPHAIVVTGEPDPSALIGSAGRDTIVLQKPLSTDALRDALSRAMTASCEVTQG